LIVVSDGDVQGWAVNKHLNCNAKQTYIFANKCQTKLWQLAIEIFGLI